MYEESGVGRKKWSVNTVAKTGKSMIVSQKCIIVLLQQIRIFR
jgi:hypothetical protein